MSPANLRDCHPTRLRQAVEDCRWRRTGLGAISVTLPDKRAVDHDYLTIGETFYPGWSAYVDGQRREVEPVERALCGVEIERGAHRVDLIFEPASVRVGCFFGLLALGLLAAIIRPVPMRLER